MTVTDLTGIGVCARLDEVGDWAFDLALDIARRHRVVLDVFFFPGSFADPHARRGRHGEQQRLTRKQAIDLEREVRMYYDARAGDYTEVGFRLCEGDEEPELRRCLAARREFDVLVLPCPARGCPLGDRTIEEFAEAMPCPTILVGPDDREQRRANSAAWLWRDRLGIRVSYLEPRQGGDGSGNDQPSFSEPAPS